MPFNWYGHGVVPNPFPSMAWRRFFLGARSPAGGELFFIQCAQTHNPFPLLFPSWKRLQRVHSAGNARRRVRGKVCAPTQNFLELCGLAQCLLAHKPILVCGPVVGDHYPSILLIDFWNLKDCITIFLYVYFVCFYEPDLQSVKTFKTENPH